MKPVRAVGYVLTTLAMYLGIPLLGWGPGDACGFFAAAPRLAYALVVAALGVAVGWHALRSPEGIRGGPGRQEKRVDRQSVVRIVVIALLYAGLAFLPFADRCGVGSLTQSHTVRWAGVGLFGVGSALVFWSGVALGKMYSGDVTLQEAHRLVTDGPYRWLRHPRYTGAVLLGFGMALTFNSWIGVVVSLSFVGIILFRIRDEEALMRDAFGPEWDAYAARTPRLIPFVY